MAQLPDGLPDHIRHYIGGQQVDSVSGETFDVLEPTTNRTYIQCASGDAADVDAAVAAARKAFDEGPWPRMLPRERANILYRVADEVSAMNARLAELESFDSGLPIRQAQGQAKRAAENFRFFADLIVAQVDDAFRMPGRQINYVNRKPKGVAGLITPWNTPFMQESWKLAPALASGCTVVLKPAEETVLDAFLMAEAAAAAVFNMVHGFGETAGDALVKHPDVNLISFTGETTTGQIIFANCAPTMKSMSRSSAASPPVIVFEDADFEAALDSTLFGVYSLNGERCTASSRILVQRSIYDRFVEAYAERARKIKVGPAVGPRDGLAALVHPTHYDRVMGYVEVGQGEARLVAGGKRRTTSPTATTSGDGLRRRPRTARIFQEEIFGPVVAITPFEDDEEAVELANDVKYGLAAYVWTNDVTRAHTVAHRIESGMVWINSHNVRDLRTPFGGVKGSGLGQEGGYRSLDFYSNQQAIHLTLGDVHTTRFGATGYSENDPGLAGPGS